MKRRVVELVQRDTRECELICNISTERLFKMGLRDYCGIEITIKITVGLRRENGGAEVVCF